MEQSLFYQLAKSRINEELARLDRITAALDQNPEEKKKELFLRQKKTLDLFLERNAISKAQYDKSLGDLVEKMGMWDML